MAKSENSCPASCRNWMGKVISLKNVSFSLLCLHICKKQVLERQHIYFRQLITQRFYNFTWLKKILAKTIYKVTLLIWKVLCTVVCCFLSLQYSGFGCVLNQIAKLLMVSGTYGSIQRACFIVFLDSLLYMSKVNGRISNDFGGNCNNIPHGYHFVNFNCDSFNCVVLLLWDFGLCH